jgi:hypothetical protein
VKRGDASVPFTSGASGASLRMSIRHSTTDLQQRRLSGETLSIRLDKSVHRIDMTADVTRGEQLLDVGVMLWSSVDRKRRNQSRRRLSRRISVGRVPPDGHPSGAGRTRGTRRPFGLFTPPRVTPHRGGASAEGRGNAGPRWCSQDTGLRPSGAPSPAWPEPTGRPSRLGPWRPRPEWPVCFWRSAAETGGSAGPAPSSGGPGPLWGALRGAVADDA